MVKLLKTGSQSMYVWRNIQLVRGRVILFALLFTSAVVLFALNEYLYASIGLITIPIAYVLGAYSYRSYLIWKSGMDGERVVNDALGELPDTYVSLNGLVIPGNRGDTDHIIFGPNGIFIVESKNYGGNISCKKDEWKKTRRLTSTKSVDTIIGSPSNQAKRNAKVLKDFILDHQVEAFGGPAHKVRPGEIRRMIAGSAATCCSCGDAITK